MVAFVQGSEVLRLRSGGGQPVFDVRRKQRWTRGSVTMVASPSPQVGVVSRRANAARHAEVEIYDTTLRDGAQGEGISLSVVDKLRIARALDEFGVAYIEGMCVCV